MAKLVGYNYVLKCHCGKTKHFTVESVPGIDIRLLLQRAAKNSGWKAGVLDNVSDAPVDACPKCNPDKGK